MQKSHWHPAVRNNASRALNYLDGNGFERVGVDKDGDPFPRADEDDYLIFSDYRYAGDYQLDHEFEYKNCKNWLEDRKDQKLSQSPIGKIRFPKRGLQDLESRDVRKSDIPKFRKSVEKQIRRHL